MTSSRAHDHEVEGLTNLTKKTHRRRLSDNAESDSVDSLICACGSPMLMRFFMRRTRGDYERVLSQKDDPESGEDGVDSGRWKNTELAMKRRYSTADEEREAEVDEKADIDSIDSLICACSSPMLMRFVHSHEVLPRS